MVIVGQQMRGVASLVVHSAQTTWMVLGAVIAVAVGYATLNMVLADSGFAVLNEHSPMLTAFMARVTRQV